jgi:hypothetical protein
MGRPYTSGIWTVKPVREEDFVARWRELAEWASVEFPGAGRPTLLRDMDQSHTASSASAPGRTSNRSRHSAATLSSPDR